MLDLVAARRGDLLLVDGAEIGENAVVEPQHGTDEVVEVIAYHAQFVEVVAADAEENARGVAHFVGERQITVLLQQFQRAGDLAAEEAELRAEVVDVEDERRLLAVAVPICR